MKKQLLPAVELDLLNRGKTKIRYIQGPRNAPTLVLLHGLAATGELNWKGLLPFVSSKYTVVLIDHLGHGDGVKSKERFKLEDCADDVAAILNSLHIPKALIAGYSMGGPIAQLLYRRHPEKVEGLILCATAASFTVPSFLALPLGVASHYLPPWTRHVMQATYWPLSPLTKRSALLQDFAHSDIRAIIDATLCLAKYNSENWLSEITCPCSVLLTTKDQLVPLASQKTMASLLPNVATFEVKADHFACVTHPATFAEQFVLGCDSVNERLKRIKHPRKAFVSPELAR